MPIPTPAAPLADIAFLHTSALHVPGFAQLVADMEPSVRATHHVREDLLSHADQPDLTAAARAGEIHQAVADVAAASGARVIVCTCSTIGATVEAAPRSHGIVITRIDRAMADEAVRRGPHLLMVAALESTLQPTHDLLLDSARRMGATVRIQPLLVQGAWGYFTQGNLHRYATTIAQAVTTQLGGASVVVLAQASMAPAAALLGHLPVRVLASPSLGVAHALRLWRRQRVLAAPEGLTSAHAPAG